MTIFFDESNNKNPKRMSANALSKKDVFSFEKKWKNATATKTDTCIAFNNFGTNP
ncbi:hypothetical protein GCM10011508_06210 [Flavobacterium lutivivi]|nr:hypothetical protein GCM10011508_06210 [Flavobacterium lutivivi]